MEVCSASYNYFGIFSPSAFDQVDWTQLQSDDVDADWMDFAYSDPSVLLSTSSRLEDIENHQFPTSTCAAPASSKALLCSRARPLPATEWARHRPNIIRLYIHEERDLEEVRRIMQERHEFDATVQMYKKKFRAWNTRKNYTKEQKEEVILLQENKAKPLLGSRDDRIVPIIVNSKQLKQHRIERYRRQKAGRPNVASSRQVSYFQPQHSPEYRNFELLLAETKYYYSWCLMQTDLGPFSYGATLDNVFDNILAGAHALTRNRSRAFALLNKGCSNMPALFEGRSIYIVHELLRCSDGERWRQSYTEVRLALLRYVKAMAEKVLGALHPLSKIVSLLVQGIAWDGAIQHVACLFLETSTQGFYKSTLPILSFQLGVCELYTDINEFDLAARAISRILKQAENSLPRSHWIFQTAQFDLGVAHSHRDDPREAERQWLETIELCIEAEGRENGSSPAIQSCFVLGRLYQDEGRDAEAEKYLRLAVDGASWVWGQDHPLILRYLGFLEHLLEDQARYEEVEQLRQEYAEVYVNLDGYYLEECGLEQVRGTSQTPNTEWSSLSLPLGKAVGERTDQAPDTSCQSSIDCREELRTSMPDVSAYK